MIIKANDSYDYLFSVVIPVYNVEEYLNETILSVVNQTIGFENIQLILVNDGSTDNSGYICEKYKSLYPNNIIYIDKENGGVSSARNEGIKHIKGKYVNFLDSDDAWSEDSFEKVYRYFEEIYSDVDVVSCRIKRFDAKNEYHPTDFKYSDGNRVLNLLDTEDENCIQVSASNVIIKSDKVTNNYFPEKVRFGEDSLFVNKIILQKMKYAVMSDAVYYYRVRQELTSAVQTQAKNESFYTDTVKEYHLGLANFCKTKYGVIYPYVQYVITYDLGWRVLNKDFEDILSKDKKSEYLKNLKEAYSNIEDEVILRHPVHKSIYKKTSALKYKYGKDPFSMMKYVKGTSPKTTGLFFNKTKVYNSFTNYVQSVSIEKGKLVVEGLVIKWLFDVKHLNVSLKFKYGSAWHTPQITEYPVKKIMTEDGEVLRQMMYRLEIPVGLKKVSQKRLRAYLVFGEEIKRMNFVYAKFVPCVSDFEKAYIIKGRFCIIPDKAHMMISRPENRSKEHKRLELDAIKWLNKNGHKNIAKLRVKYWLYKILVGNRKKIWLLSDRIDNAGDNGEVLFKYLCKHKPRKVKPIFIISKKAAAAKRLKKIGKVIYPESKKFLLYYLLADKVISSGASEFTINPFDNDKCYILDLLNFKFYYLQHGVACADLSSWLNRYNKNIDKFFVSSAKEFSSIVDGNYLYDESNVKLTGMARFDDLTNNPQKLILIMPTWRRTITESYDKNTRSIYYDGFKNTDYFKFYNSLINNEKLLSTMRKKGYKGLFCLHPIHMKQWVDFDANDVFSVNEGFVNYYDVFEKSALMITDYSSVLFDFTYLRKPVVYSQFDKVEFFEKQIYDEGYFSYENDGFGPVCYDLDSTVDEIIKAIENDCKLLPCYQKRIDDFYAFSDKNNCERIYNVILDDDE